MNQDRVSAGVPTGGRYAATERSEATSSLRDEPKPCTDGECSDDYCMGECATDNLSYPIRRPALSVVARREVIKTASSGEQVKVETRNPIGDLSTGDTYLDPDTAMMMKVVDGPRSSVGMRVRPVGLRGLISNPRRPGRFLSEHVDRVIERKAKP